MQKTRVTVLVAGQTLKLRGSGDEAHIRKIAAYLDENVKEVAGKNPGLSTNTCLLLSALNITEELFRLQEKYEELDARIAELREISTPLASAAKKTVKAPIKHPFEQTALTRKP